MESVTFDTNISIVNLKKVLSTDLVFAPWYLDFGCVADWTFSQNTNENFKFSYKLLHWLNGCHRGLPCREPGFDSRAE